MEKALENLAGMNASKKVVILGDMFELGDDTKSEHMQIGNKLKELNIDEAFFCGESMKYAYEAFGHGYYMKTKDFLIEYLKDNTFVDATILIKASRGMALEEVVDYL